MVKSGHDPKQAAAAAYREAGKDGTVVGHVVKRGDKLYYRPLSANAATALDVAKQITATTDAAIKALGKIGTR